METMMGGFVKQIADPLDLLGAQAADKKAEEAQRTADAAAKRAAEAESMNAETSPEEELRRRRRGASILAPRNDQALGGSISRPGAQTLG
jgi:hypothetical protein